MKLKQNLKHNKFINNGHKITLQILILTTIIILLDHLNILPTSQQNKYIIIYPLIAITYFTLSYLKNKTNPKTQNINLIITILALTILTTNSILKLEIIKQLDYIFYTLIILTTTTLTLTNNKTTNQSKQTKQNKTIPKKIYLPLLTIIIILAFTLRITNLTALDPYTDEYYHLSAANNIDKYNEMDYQRGQIITYSVYTSQKIFQPSTYLDKLFFARLPGIILSTLLIIPLFLITKRLSTLTALIASLLLAISPWAIGISKTIREYAYYPFFILLGIYLLLIFFDHFKSKKEILKYRKKELKILLSICIYFAIFGLFSIFIDKNSTLKIGLLMFGLTGIYIIISKFKIIKQYYNQNPTIVSIILFLTLSTICSASYYAVTINQQVGIDDLEYQSKWSDLFLNPLRETPMQWWNTKTITTNLIYFLILLGIITSITTKKYEYLNYILIFFGTLIFYSYFFDRYFKPRYIFYLLPILIIIISHSISTIYNTFNNTKNKPIKLIGIITLTLFILSITNFSNTNLATTWNTYPTNNATGEYHDKIRLSLLNTTNTLTENDHIITGREQIIDYLSNVNKNNIHYYDYRNKTRIQDSINFMQQHPKGYIIIDKRRNKKFAKGFPQNNITYNITPLKKVQLTMLQNNNWHIYKWKTIRSNTIN